MKRIVLNLARPVRRRLERAALKTRDAAYRTRVRVVLLYAQGWGATRIAEALGCASCTALRVVHRFLQEGEAGLQDARRDNGTPKVDTDMLQALTELVGGVPQQFGWQRTNWTRELMAEALEAFTGQRVSVTTVSRMLGRIRARWGMARPTVLCPWSKQRKGRRLRCIRDTIGNLPPGEVAYYEDEVDIHLNPRIGRDWMLPGRQKVVVTPGQNVKRYVAGALASDGSRLIFATADRKNSQLFIALLERLRRGHPGASRIRLVLDNYAIHGSRAVRSYLAQHDDLFLLHLLPPYSPEHNKIERLWRELHANITRNHRCRSIQELMARVEWYLSCENRWRRRVLKPASHSNPRRRSVA
jgi:transposase